MIHAENIFNQTSSQPGARPGTGFMKQQEKYYMVECMKCHKKHRHYFGKPKPCPHCGSRWGKYKNRPVILMWEYKK